MSKKQQKLVLHIKKGEIEALIGNAHEFDQCDGLSESLLKLRSTYLDEHKFTLTKPNYICMYAGVLSALNGIRYPTMTGNEYKSLLEIRKRLETEYKRQTQNELCL